MKQRWKFLPRLLKFRHLELDSALQQVLWTVAYPKRVFRYHQDQYGSSEMRGYRARDDPAFLLLLCLFMSVSAIGYGLWLQLPISGVLYGWVWTVMGDCLATGVLMAVAMWLIANKLLSQQPGQNSVEWAYCFDVHLNAFFPFALGIYGVQLLLWPLLSRSGMAISLLANTIWLLSTGYYVYMTFLGYTVLPSSRHTTLLLYTMLPLLVLYIIALPLGWNFCSAFGTLFAWRTGTA